MNNCPVCQSQNFVATHSYGDETNGFYVTNTSLKAPIYAIQAFGLIAVWCEECGFSPAKQWLNLKGMLS